MLNNYISIIKSIKYLAIVSFSFFLTTNKLFNSTINFYYSINLLLLILLNLKLIHIFHSIELTSLDYLNMMKIAENTEETCQNTRKGSTRFVIVGLLFCMFSVQYGIRVGLSLSIIAMTTEGTSSNPDVPVSDHKSSSSSYVNKFKVLRLG